MSLNTFDLYLFGGTGDLSSRKLIPAMFRQETLSSICTESNIIGIGSRNLTTDEYVEMVKDSLQKYFPSFDQHKDTWKLFSARISYIQIAL